MLRVLKYPHPALRHKSKPLCRVDGELKNIVREMFDLMYEHKGIGLAANQVNLPYRFFILNPEGEPKRARSTSLSIRRSSNAADRRGRRRLLEFSRNLRPGKTIGKDRPLGLQPRRGGTELRVTGLLGRATQHEYDHLDGVLFIDRLTPTGLLSVKQALVDLEREFQGDRQRGVIPDDQQIASRLAELEQLAHDQDVQTPSALSSRGA